MRKAGLGIVFKPDYLRNIAAYRFQLVKILRLYILHNKYAQRPYSNYSGPYIGLFSEAPELAGAVLAEPRGRRSFRGLGV